MTAARTMPTIFALNRAGALIKFQPEAFAVCMGLSESFSKIRIGLVALVLLGACELLAIDIWGNYLVIFRAEQSGVFIFATLAIALFSSVVMCIMVLRLWLKHNAHHLDAAKSGAFVGACAAAGVSAILLLMGAIGMGAVKVFPHTVTSGGMEAVAIAYAVSVAAVFLLYIMGGALLGWLAAIAAPYVEKGWKHDEEAE